MRQSQKKKTGNTQGVFKKVGEKMDAQTGKDGYIFFCAHETEGQGPGRFPGSKASQSFNGKS